MNLSNENLESIKSPLTTPKSVKRRRSQNSPELELVGSLSKKQVTMNSPEMVCLSTEQLMNIISKTFDQKMINLPSKDDFKHLECKIEALVNENISVKNEIKMLRIENDNLRKQMNIIDNKLRKNNVIVRGLVVEDGANLKKSVEDIWQNVLKVDCCKINNVIPIGKIKENKQFLVQMDSGNSAINVLKKAKLLKGSGIFINQDLSAYSRNKRSKLHKLRKEIMRLNPTLKARLRDDYLLIGNVRFDWSDGNELIVGNVNGEEMLSKLVGADISAAVRQISSHTNSGK